MNSRLTSQLDSFASTVDSAADAQAIQAAIVSIEETVLKSNLEEQSTAPTVVQDYLVGEANTRGLSWKLNLLRQVAAANFCQLVRVGVHGGTVRLIGQQENIDITLRIYDALVSAYEALSAKEFTAFVDGQPKEEGVAAPHRVGWTNKFLVGAPDDAFAAVTSSRESASSNKKVADLIAEKNSGIAELKSTLAPAKPERAPKEPKAPKAPKGPKAPKSATNGEVDGTDSASEASEATQAAE